MIFTKVLLTLLSLSSFITTIGFVVYSYSGDAAFGFGLLTLVFVVVLIAVEFIGRVFKED